MPPRSRGISKPTKSSRERPAHPGVTRRRERADVGISPSEQGHLQATGRDAKGPKQSRYHPEFRAEREDLKFSALVPFAEVLGGLRARVALSERPPTLERQTALIVHLLDLTAMRVGNEAYVVRTIRSASRRRTRRSSVHGATFRTWSGRL